MEVQLKVSLLEEVMPKKVDLQLGKLVPLWLGRCSSVGGVWVDYFVF